MSPPLLVGSGTVAPASADTTPDNFSFINQTDVVAGSQITSAPITVQGLGLAVQVSASVSGGTHSLNGGAFTSSPFLVQNGNTVRVQCTASALASTAVNVTETIGGVSAIFTATTAAPVVGLANGAIDSINSGSINITMPTVLAWDDFESGANGAAISAPPFGSYSGSGATYSTVRSHSGTKSSRHVFSSAGGQQFKPIETPLPQNANGRFIYISHWMYIEAASMAFIGTGQLKLDQVHGPDTPTVGQFTPGFFHGVLDANPSERWWAEAICRTEATADSSNQVTLAVWADSFLNSWRKIEHFYRQSSAPNVADGQLRTLINGVQVYNVNNVITRESNRWAAVNLFCYGATNCVNYPIYHGDEHYVQASPTGWQRVVIHTSTPYSATQEQIPAVITSVGAGTLSYRVQRGAVPTGDHFVTVLDGNNNVLVTVPRTFI